jgi:hypothetical protein
MYDVGKIKTEQPARFLFNDIPCVDDRPHTPHRFEPMGQLF